jgi:diadenosine tetraphosphate (Ap4A) HIT family hydrolase
MCLFCDLTSARDKHLYEDDLVYAIYDHFPVAPGHALIIPKRHIETIFEATPAEHAAIGNALTALKKIVDSTFHPDAYNVGINNGVRAGQTIMHLHVHLIPRFAGDSDRPRGGVRGIIPGKQDY